MNERQTEALFNQLGSIDDKQNETLTQVRLTSQVVEQHLQDHPAPALIAQHLAKADEAEKVVRNGFWSIAIKAIGSLIALILAAALAWIVANSR